MKTTFNVILFTLVSLTASAQIIDSAVGIIPFNNSIEEVLSNTSPEVNGSFTFIEDHLGNPNNAIKLGCQFNYGNPEFSRMDTSDFSITYWFRKDGSLWQEQPIVQKRASLNNPFFYEEYGSFYSDWIGDGHMQISFKPMHDSSGVYLPMGTIPDSTWTHIAITFDRDGFLKTYINAEFLNEKYIGDLESLSANIDSASLVIGWTNMSLDEILFFKKALTPDEVIEIYTSPPVTSIDPIYSNTEERLSIFPNPSDGQIKLKIEELITKTFSMKLYNYEGKILINKSNLSPLDKLELDLSDYTAGLYFVILETDEKRYFGKIVLN